MHQAPKRSRRVPKYRKAAAMHRQSVTHVPGMDPGFGLPAERFELPTNGLQNRCSTTELSRHFKDLSGKGCLAALLSALQADMAIRPPSTGLFYRTAPISMMPTESLFT